MSRILQQTVLILALCVAIAASAVPASLEVPFIRQTKEGCGSAAIAMIMEYWRDQLPAAGIPRPDVAGIQQRLHTPEARGIYGADMENFFRESGFHAFRLKASEADLSEHLSRGRPLIVCLQPGRGAPLHYVVLIGYDASSESFLINDPARGKSLREDAANFRKAWKATGNWTMLAVPKGS